MSQAFNIFNFLTIVALAAVPLMQVGCTSGGRADNRKFGSILNNDGNNILWHISGEDATPDEYRKALEHLLDAKPGILAQSIGQPDPVFYLSEVATPWFKYRGQWEDSKAMKALADAGTDPLALTVEVCKKRGVPILASFRMNAEDLGNSNFKSSDFGRKNKHLRVGEDRNCLDPAHPAVYEHRMQIFAEVIDKYDLDGLEFDYKRWNHMISNPAENHVILTRMLRETRKMLDEAAKRKGRKRLLLGVRVQPQISGALNPQDYPGANGAPFNQSCDAAGLDIKTWIDEELVDYVCPSLFWPPWPGLPRIAEFVELAKGKNVGIYPTVWPRPAWLNTKTAPPIERDDAERMRRYKNELCDIILTCYRDGADGISTYNWTPHHQEGMLPDPGRANWGDGAKALQMHIHGLMSDAATVEAYRNSQQLIPPTSKDRTP